MSKKQTVDAQAARAEKIAQQKKVMDPNDPDTQGQNTDSALRELSHRLQRGEK